MPDGDEADFAAMLGWHGSRSLRQDGRGPPVQVDRSSNRLRCATRVQPVADWPFPPHPEWEGAYVEGTTTSSDDSLNLESRPAGGLPGRTASWPLEVFALLVQRAVFECALIIAVLAALVSVLPAACGDVPVHEPDRAALVALYNATDGLDWSNNLNWLSDKSLGEWHGVTTDPSGRVTHLDLSRNGLAGQIPAEVGSLQELQLLYLAGNQLSGPVPPELGDLHNLTSLSLHGNELSGEVPPQALDGLVKLTWLALGANDLRGCVPSSLRDPLADIFPTVRGLPFCDEVPPARPCRVGMKLKPGEYCTIDTILPSDSSWHPAWPYQMVVEGEIACLGYLCSIERIDKIGFRATKNPDRSWTVHVIP